METQIFCDYLISGQGGVYQTEKNKILHIRDGKFISIDSFHPDEKLDKNLQKTQTIYLKNHLVCPGFINTHTHLPMSLFRGLGEGLPLKKWLDEIILPLEKKLMNEEFVLLGAELSSIELIRFGVTTVFDMYFHSVSSARALDKAGLRGFFGEGSPVGWKSRVEDFLKEFSNHKRIHAALAPHSPYCSSEKDLIETRDFQKKHNLPWAIHISETHDEIRKIAKNHNGKTPISYLHDLDIKGEKTLYVHCVHAEDEDLKMMSQSKTPLSHNPESNMKLGSGISPVSKAIDYGVCVSLGTDGQASNNNLNIMGEMQTCAFLSSLQQDYRSLKVQEILNMVFLGAAKAMNMEDQIGSIEIGKRADLIGIDLNQAHWHPYHDLVSHLVYSSTGSEVHFVMCEGKILMSNREIKTLDEEKIYWQTEQLRRNKLSN